MKKMTRGLYVFRGITAFIIIACITSGVSATLISGSDGTTYLAESNGSYTINIQVDYGVYDGASGDDPLGANGDIQLGFVLTHLGAGGAGAILPMGRFVVHNPTAVSFTDYNYKDDPLEPSDIPPHAPAGYGGAIGLEGDDVVFNFISDFWVADFVTGNMSMILAVSMAPQDLPGNILIETDELYSIGEVNVLVPIVVPEPASMVLFGIGLSVLSIRRKRRQ